VGDFCVACSDWVVSVSLEWIPGHMNIMGNEKADEAAKEAAKSLGTEDATTFKHNALNSSRTNDHLKECGSGMDKAKREGNREPSRAHHQKATG